jgi:hypothetical protein
LRVALGLPGCSTPGFSKHLEIASTLATQYFNAVLYKTPVGLYAGLENSF